jgi:cyanophycinase
MPHFRRLPVSSCLVLLLLVPASLWGHDKEAGSAAATAWKEAQEEQKGTLFIVGGGALPEAVRDEFVKLAGGSSAKIVVIPTASSSFDSKATEPWKRTKVASVKLLHLPDKAKADDPALVKPLTEATAVWFGGGDQSRLMAAYHGTRVEKELRKLLERGGVIGGTSAGAAVMSRQMIAGGKAQAELKEGFGFLPGLIVDQHFTQRQRLPRLLDALKKQPGHVGIGVDEQTALIVSKRRLSVVGNGQVTICLLSGGGKRQKVEMLKAGGSADLVALRRAALFRALTLFPPEKPAEPHLEKGALVIGGGGRMPSEVVKRFIALAGGPESLIVVIPTALEDGMLTDPGEARMLRQAGAKNVKVLHTRSREEADRAEFLAPLKEAKGVWFTGGRQWRFVDAYEGTATEAAFHEVLARGGVIGGSSAGASIQSEYMPRGDPLGNRNIIAEGYERGFGFLKGVAVDQHFFVRRRQKDMTELMKTYPQLLGIGIDEGTAVIVQGSVMEVVGATKAAVYDYRSKPSEGADYVEVPAGSRYDLVKRAKLPNSGQ